MHLQWAVGMTLLSGAAGIVGNGQIGLGIEVLEQTPAVFEKGFPQSQFDGFEIADALAGHLLAGQSQESFGFLESLVLDFLGLEFFLLWAKGLCSRVIWSLKVT
jgi:hypothetical protein